MRAAPVPLLPLFRPPSLGEGAGQRHLGPCQKVLSPGRRIKGHVMGSLARVFARGSLTAWRDARVQGDTTKVGRPQPTPTVPNPLQDTVPPLQPTPCQVQGPRAVGSRDEGQHPWNMLP